MTKAKREELVERMLKDLLQNGNCMHEPWQVVASHLEDGVRWVCLFLVNNNLD